MSDKITIDTLGKAKAMKVCDAHLDTYYNWLTKTDNINLSHIDYDIKNSYIHYIKENNLKFSKETYADFVKIRNEDNNLNILDFDDYFDIVDYIPEINEFYNWNNKHINLKKYAECIFDIITKQFNSETETAHLLDTLAYYDNFHYFILDDYSIHSKSDLYNYFDID